MRRDRSMLLVGELGGRLDRRDLMLVMLVFVSALLLRTYRLEVPYGMHFDEVYHARTATEFLQDWRYDIPHSIYEYTHPHLAKYLMAVGIEVLGNNRVTDLRDLGVPIKAGAIETRWGPPDAVNERNGDRLYVVTADDVRVFDLATKALVATIDGAYVSAAIDEGTHVLYLADSSGAISTLATGQFDDIRAGVATAAARPQAFTSVDLEGGLSRLAIASDQLFAVGNGGEIVGLDAATGAETARTTLDGVTSIVGIPSHNRVMLDPAAVDDFPGLASALAGLLEADADQLQGEISRATDRIAIAGYISGDRSDDVQAAIDEGTIPGISLEDGAGIAVGTSEGIVLLDAETLGELATFNTPAPVGGLDLVEQGPDQPTIYAATASSIETVRLPSDDAARTGDTIKMPNAVNGVFWNPATAMVHVLGLTQDGTAPTVYVIEPRANAVFADARLDTQPVAVLLDVQSQRPTEDRDDLLALDSAGKVATVDIGNNQFAYRFPGVIAGALMAVCLYLLARFLFRRRIVALIISLFALADGMFFANARIAMNDTYVALFIVAAFTLFVPLWLERWRNRWAIAAGLVGVGILLGLALASKWVGAYAIGGVGLLILLRSALGRMIALVALIGMTGLLGVIAISPNPSVENPQVNYPFLGLMIALTTLLAVGMTLRPVRMTKDELRLAVAAAILPGVALIAYGAYGLATRTLQTGTLTATRAVAFGGGLAVIGIVVLGAAWFAGRRGHGPLAGPGPVDPDAEPASPPPSRGWLRPGSGFLGLSWILALGAITVIPLVVYMISYIPWIDLGNQWFTGFPAGHSGQTFLDLQKSMYEYHNYLRATHPASSPWWAWPLDLKPVWFEQRDYSGGTTAVIYDTGNLVLFWLAIPAVAWVAWQAWKRRSLQLTFITIAIASLWLPWARIDRATFQYHIFTTLPFSFLALAYFVAELWHGPSRRTWALARVAAAIAVIGAPLLWLFRLPLCGIARTETVNAGTEVCGSLSRQLALTDLQTIGLVLAVGGLIAAAVLFAAGRSKSRPLPIEPDEELAPPASTRRSLLLPVCFGLALFGVAMMLIGAGLPGRAVLQMQVVAEYPAIAALALLLVPAYFVLRARDPRRFVVGVLGAAVIWFITFYPNFASLPVPTALSQIHLGLLPTWNWGFQFGVNMDEPNRASPDIYAVAMLSVAVAAVCVAAAYAAHGWRTTRTEESSVSALPETG